MGCMGLSTLCGAEQGFAGDGEQRPLRSRSSPRLKPGVRRPKAWEKEVSL
jgi:hypothetical protein